MIDTQHRPETKPGIYEILNIVNCKRYIGATCNISRRLAEHKRKLKANQHFNKHLQFSFNKYGQNNFRFNSVLVCHADMLNYYEERLIKMYGSDNSDIGYNTESGGNIVPKSDATRRKLSRLAKIRFADPKNNPMYGKHHTKNAKKLISMVHKGKVIPMSVREQTSKTLTGKKQIKKNTRIIIQLNHDDMQIVELFTNIGEAANSVGAKCSMIQGACRMNILSKGYYWMFLDDFNKRGVVRPPMLPNRKDYKPIIKLTLDGDIVNIYEGLQTAATYNHITPTAIYNYLHGRTKKAAESLWMFLDEFNKQAGVA